ncbi:MAG TPA: PAS domain S-box protein [Casimicrobiaceae bacterium]|nr:PAS domain S-box protein [Casimicrobiaceae bacterium]
MNEGLRSHHRLPKRASKARDPGFPSMLIHRDDETARRVRVAVSSAIVSGGRAPTAATFASTESGAPASDARAMADEMRDLYDNAPCGYHSIDPAGLIVRINATELGWLGYARDEVVGRLRMTDLMTPRWRGQFAAKFALLKQQGRLNGVEYEMQRKDGTAFPVLVNVLAIYGADGRFAHSRASVIDISTRKQAEIELSESELRNTAIVHAALDCIVSIDSHGMITEFNPAAEKTFGYSREQVIGRDVAETIIPPAMRSDHRRGLERYLATGEGRLLGTRVEITAMRSDGSEFPVELAITPVSLRDQTIFTAYMRDITREKWAEEKLCRFADEIQSVSRRLVEIQETERRALASELHDLVGQKLTALSINLNIVKLESAASMTSQSGARLQDSLKLVSETIESIRDVMVALRPAVLDDYGVTSGLRWYAAQFAKRTGVAVTVIEQGETRRLPANAEETFFRIAQEALTNVARYARVEKATVTLRTMPDSIRLTVEDDGCGFDPSAARRPARDHGWGLMIMKERAAALGAELTVESAPGSGTRITVTLEA